MKKRRKRRAPARALLTVLLVALCAVIMTRLGAFGGPGEVSIAQTPTPVETAIFASEDTQTMVGLLIAEAPPPEAAPDPVARYAGVSMTAEEREELAAAVYLEAGNQCAEGQQAVVEVVLNRVISTDFPDSVHDVLHQGEETKIPQFSTVYGLSTAEPARAQYEAIDAAIYGPSVLPSDVVYFSRAGENDRVWGEIGDHVFCYGYVWE